MLAIYVLQALDRPDLIPRQGKCDKVAEINARNYFTDAWYFIMVHCYIWDSACLYSFEKANEIIWRNVVMA